MNTRGMYGDSMADRFRQEHARAWSAVRMNCGASFAVTRLSCGDEGLGKTLPIPVEPAFIVVLLLRPLIRHELWLEDKSKPVEPWQGGSVSVVNLEQSPSAYIGGALDALHFYLPQPSLESIAASSGTRTISELVIPGGTVDPVIYGLGRLMLPALQRPEQANELFLSGLMTSFHAHLSHTYGGISSKSLQIRGGLSPTQLNQAKEMIAANLLGNISLIELAASCDLSPAHFARAFKRSTGVAPHRWLLMRRIEVAKHMLTLNESNGAEVAFACGFADQSHLIRVFSSIVGMTPREWQRRNVKRGLTIDCE